MRRLPGELRQLWRLRRLPPRVARFQWRARRLAWRSGDAFSLTSATRAADLAVLLELAAGRSSVVELGTATGWTAIALALDDPRRRVLSFDPVSWPQREQYLELVDRAVRERIELIRAPGSSGPRDGTAIDLLYVDSGHAKEETIAELRAWKPVLPPRALVVFDDYTHSAYPGVRDAVAELGLPGVQRGTLYIHEVGRPDPRLSSRSAPPAH